MAFTRCPECRKKISESAQFCPNCGFSFKVEDLEIYKQKLEQRHRQNAEINRKSTTSPYLVGYFYYRYLIGKLADGEITKCGQKIMRILTALHLYCLDIGESFILSNNTLTTFGTPIPAFSFIAMTCLRTNPVLGFGSIK